MMLYGISQFVASLLLSSALVQGTPLTNVEREVDAVKPIKVGSTITFHATTKHYKKFYLAHTQNDVDIQPTSNSNTTAEKQTAMWNVRKPLNASASHCVSFESVDTSGSYIRHYAFELYIDQPDGSDLFNNDATWCPVTGFAKHGTTSLQSLNYPNRYFRHFDEIGYAASNGGSDPFDNPKHFKNDASWRISSGFGKKHKRSEE